MTAFGGKSSQKSANFIKQYFPFRKDYKRKKKFGHDSAKSFHFVRISSDLRTVLWFFGTATFLHTNQLEITRFQYTLDCKKLTLSWCKKLVPPTFVNFEDFWSDDKVFVHYVKRLKGHCPLCNFFLATPLASCNFY